MRFEDQDTFFKSYITACSMCGHHPASDEVITSMFEALIDFPIEAVVYALKAHTLDPDRGRFAPKPADIAYQLQRYAPTRVGADEAYTAAIQPESVSVWITDEMLQAREVMNSVTDPVAQRMAFKSAYQRICDQNAKMGIHPRWIFSSGIGIPYDQRANDYSAVTIQAIKQGWIQAGNLLRYEGAGYFTEDEYLSPRILMGVLRGISQKDAASLFPSLPDVVKLDILKSPKRRAELSFIPEKEKSAFIAIGNSSGNAPENDSGGFSR